MIRKLHIKNYKILTDNEFDFSNLNVLTGLNGMGKSSVIQTLLLLRQSYQKDNALQKQGLLLRAENAYGYVEIGNADDAFSQSAEPNEQLSFKVAWNQEVNFCFDYFRSTDTDTQLRDQIKNATSLRNHEGVHYPDEIFEQESLFKSDNYFQYLNAERLGPKAFNDTSNDLVVSKKELGKYGEYALHYLDQYKTEVIGNELVHHPAASSNRLEQQVNAWLSEITPGTRLNTFYMADIQKVKGTFDIGQGTGFRPTNVGFGLTYVLPVILALLTTKEGGTIIIENPESHLHPAGQAALAKLIARCAASSRQVFIETHSDHLINGILLACRAHDKGEQGINREQVKMYYFDQDLQESKAVIEQIVILPGGKISNQPDNFFDQIDKDMEKLMGF